MTLSSAIRLPTRFLSVFVAMTLIACTTPAVSPLREASGATAPIWRAEDSTAPVGVIRLLPGSTVEVAVSRSVTDPAISIDSIRYAKDRLALQVQVSGKKIKLRAPDKITAGRGIVEVNYTAASGRSATLAIPVVLQAYPMLEFRYDPAGRSVNNVFVAGEFNGWAGAKDRLERQPDGTFATSLPIAPGGYAYKFVVDGEWISDPGNPRQDGSGYGNSLLDVPGSQEETLDFAALSEWMPGGSPHGAVRLVGPEGATLAPALIDVVLNNQLLSRGDFKVNVETGVIELPATGLASNHAVIFARDMRGRTGEFEGFFDLATAPRTPRDEIMYFAMTDRFFNGKPELDKPAVNDELHPLANYHGGDWEGIRQKIEEGYFDRLGITTIWISPVNRNTDKVERDAVPPHRLFSSYHGYWPVSLHETNPQFGSMEDLQALVKTAHEHGIAVLLDFVANHVHEDHPLIKEHPDWVVPLELPDGRKNIRLFDEHPLTTWFDAFLPTLNYENNTELISIMSDNAIWWLEQSGADGFRHDAVKHIPVPFWEALTERMRSRARNDGRGYYQVGETISDRATINRFVSPHLMDGQFDFPLLWTIHGTLGRGEGSMRDLGQAVMDSYEQYPAAAIMSPLLGNHDTVRFMALADGDFPVEGLGEKEVGYVRPPQVDNLESYERIKLGFALLLTIPGAPAIYYGDEIGQTGAHDPDNRRSLEWTNRTAEQEMVYETLSELASVRSASVALRRGGLRVIKETDEELVFIRTAPGETVLVALLRRPMEPVSIDLPEWWGEAVSFEPLMTKEAEIETNQRAIRVRGGDWSFGIWRVRGGK